MRKINPFFAGAVSGVLVFLLSAVLWVGSSLTKSVQNTAGLFAIRRGQSLRDVAFSLSNQGIIDNPVFLIWYGEATGRDKSIQAGVYRIVSSLKVKDLLELFGQGSNVHVQVLLPEGITLKESITRVQTAGLDLDEDVFAHPPKKLTALYRFLQDAPEGASLEGFIFPDTYTFNPGQETIRVAQTMLDALSAKFKPEWYQEIGREGHSVYQTIVMASILEKEVRTAGEKKIAAGILWRRLAVGMPLQVDSSLNYVTGKNTPAASFADLAIDSPYNTYKNQGLPPGPISNPGLESIEAAIHPTSSDYWFYLSRQDTGQTIFSKTYKQHALAKARYLR